MMTALATNRSIVIEVVKHATSDLFVAYSNDLPGLMVSGRDEKELTERVPGSVRELLEARGSRVISVELHPADGEMPPAFQTRRMMANAELEMAR